MRRLLGPSVDAARLDVSVAAFLDTVSEDEDNAAWAAYRRAEREERRGGSEGRGKTGGSREEAAGRISYGFDRRTGERNRCYTRNGAYHYAPQCPQKEDRSSEVSPYQRVPETP